MILYFLFVRYYWRVVVLLYIVFSDRNKLEVRSIFVEMCLLVNVLIMMYYIMLVIFVLNIEFIKS